MTLGWIIITIILTTLAVIGLIFILGACGQASEADRWHDKLVRELEAESERVVRHGDQHPWVER